MFRFGRTTAAEGLTPLPKAEAALTETKEQAAVAASA
jgi:hypothetical protein